MQELTRYAVEMWIKTIATGEFHFKEVLGGRVSPSSYDKLRKIMHDICKAGDVCEPCGRRDGHYRPIQQIEEIIDWQELPSGQGSPLILPFNLRDYVFIYPETITIVGGSKGSCKTGFIYRTVALNMNQMNTVLITNMEGGQAQLKDRFDAMDIEIPKPAPFRVIRATSNYHDYVKEPNTLYAIDYIDAPEGADFYLIGAAVGKVQKALKDNSVAVIGLQKPSWRDIPFGGEGVLRDATLTIALGSNKLKIVDAKVPANPLIIPKNMMWTFKHKNSGTNFVEIKPYQQNKVEEQDEIPF